MKPFIEISSSVLRNPYNKHNMLRTVSRTRSDTKPTVQFRFYSLVVTRMGPPRISKTENASFYSDSHYIFRHAALTVRRREANSAIPVLFPFAGASPTQARAQNILFQLHVLPDFPLQYMWRPMPFARTRLQILYVA